MTASVSVHLIKKNEKPFIQFDFTGHLDEASAVKAISEWRKELANIHTPVAKVDLIYNCISMTGFDTAARKRWQETMKELQPRTDVIWIVSDNIFIIGAAKTMGILTRYTIKSVKSLEEIRT
jgi:hypothetical protein